MKSGAPPSFTSTLVQWPPSFVASIGVPAPIGIAEVAFLLADGRSSGHKRDWRFILPPPGPPESLESH